MPSIFSKNSAVFSLCLSAGAHVHTLALSLLFLHRFFFHSLLSLPISSFFSYSSYPLPLPFHRLFGISLEIFQHWFESETTNTHSICKRVNILMHVIEHRTNFVLTNIQKLNEKRDDNKMYLKQTKQNVS